MGEVTEEVNEENKQIIYLSIYLSNLDTQCTNDHTWSKQKHCGISTKMLGLVNCRGYQVDQ